MAISSISSGGGWPMNEMQNRISRMGQQQTAQIARQDDHIVQVSNFGNETKLGTSHFQRNNAHIESTGGHDTATIMERAKSYYAVSNFGNETKLGSSEF